MVHAVGKALSFEEFLEQYPNNGGCYELIEGEVVEVRPTGTHEDIGGYQLQRFTGMETLVSRMFPNLCLTATQIFQARV